MSGVLNEQYQSSGHELWLSSNAIACVVFMAVLFIGGFFIVSSMANVAEIRQNWNQYRCDPSIMPFAGLYGYNTAQNFNFCMGSIFTTHSADMSSSFSSILGTFGSIISTLMTAINSVRTSVATLGGGVNTVFQNMANRISMFFFQLRISAIHIKYLIGRLYAVMFAVMYMGMSSITGLTSFTRTSLFGFLDTFCFPPYTLIKVKGTGVQQIRDIRIGDILLPSNSRVTATFQFQAYGQKMVRFQCPETNSQSPTQSFKVSSNHYIRNGADWVRADVHPDGVACGEWTSDIPLHCLNTDNHIIPVGEYTFCDYDENEGGDTATMKMLEMQINGRGCNISNTDTTYDFKEYSPSMNIHTGIIMKNGSRKSAKNIVLGDKLSTGATVVGVIEREVYEICKIGNTELAAATCLWDSSSGHWTRVGDMYPIIKLSAESGIQLPIYRAFIVTPSSQIELEGGYIIRDYLEVCSPDSEKHYTSELSRPTNKTNGFIESG